jgi:hypothetical protein
MRAKPAIFMISVLVLLLLNSPVFAQQTSLEGNWWVTLGRGEKGAATFTFSDLNGWDFKVSGNGMLMKKKKEFAVSSSQTLDIDFRGNITGELDLEDSGLKIGSLQIIKGKVNKTSDSMSLQGNLSFDDSSSVKVQLKGQRIPTSPPILMGATKTGKMTGKGVGSNTFNLTVEEDSSHKFPFLKVDGRGNVNVDGSATNVTLSADLILKPFKSGAVSSLVFGQLSSSELGNGFVTGNLRNDTGVPRVNLRAVTDDRTFSITGPLNIPVTPVIDVTPTGVLEFGSIKKDDFNVKSFTVTNKGTGTLTGRASVVGAGFTIKGLEEYSLSKGSTGTIEIQFHPTTAGNFSGTVTFTGGGGATRTVTGIGVQPVAATAEF